MSALLSVRYASAREQAAWAELFRHFMDDGVDPFEVRRRVGAAEVAGLEVLDLTDETVYPLLHIGYFRLVRFATAPKTDWTWRQSMVPH